MLLLRSAVTMRSPVWTRRRWPSFPLKVCLPSMYSSPSYAPGMALLIWLTFRRPAAMAKAAAMAPRRLAPDPVWIPL